MTNPENREQKLSRKQQEIRLKELETQIYQEQRPTKNINYSQPPLYKTRKHNLAENALKKFSRKIVNLAKFTVFVILGIAFIRVGFLVGMWITYLVMTAIIAFIGYQIFLKENEE